MRVKESKYMSVPAKHVVMLASENDALIGGKVGGVGDVVRDLPRALATLGWRATVIVPSYGVLHKKNTSSLQKTIRFPFGGKETEGEIWSATPKQAHEGVSHLIVHHPDIGGEPIYHNDPPEHAFARDATKFALFCSAAGQFCKTLEEPYLLHLHDWHTGFFFLLQQLHTQFLHLREVKTVFTVHNIALQGTRPILGQYASLKAWFPELFQETSWISSWKDSRYNTPCFTPMAAAIRFARKVNTVSLTYAEEILLPSDHQNGFYGGEGLQNILQNAKREKKLFGILNGAEYPLTVEEAESSFQGLCELMKREALVWNKKKADKLFQNVFERIQEFGKHPPSILLTSITRAVEQKLKLFYERNSKGIVAIDAILHELARQNGLFIILGSGASEYEQQLHDSFNKHQNMIFLDGYSDPVARALYACGDIFLMPSSFEPCGIGQMIAMREGQPCVVHAVGGLKDTVVDGVSGFTFGGATLGAQTDNFITAVSRAVRVFFENKHQWEMIVTEAKNVRFTWEKSARKYVELMYQ